MSSHTPLAVASVPKAGTANGHVSTVSATEIVARAVAKEEVVRFTHEPDLDHVDAEDRNLVATLIFLVMQLKIPEIQTDEFSVETTSEQTYIITVEFLPTMTSLSMDELFLIESHAPTRIRNIAVVHNKIKNILELQITVSKLSAPMEFTQTRVLRIGRKHARRVPY